MLTGSDIFWLKFIYDTMGNIQKDGPAHLGPQRHDDKASPSREGYLDWYTGHGPLLYMLSVLATMLSKRCVTKQNIPLTPLSHPRMLLRWMLPMRGSLCVAPYACVRGV